MLLQWTTHKKGLDSRKLLRSCVPQLLLHAFPERALGDFEVAVLTDADRMSCRKARSEAHEVCICMDRALAATQQLADEPRAHHRVWQQLAVLFFSRLATTAQQTLLWRCERWIIWLSYGGSQGHMGHWRHSQV